MKNEILLSVFILLALLLWVLPVAAQAPQDLRPQDESFASAGPRPAGIPSAWSAGIRPAGLRAPPSHLPVSALPPGVRRSVPLPYTTIQAAINASSDGDTVLVSEGTYYENIRYRGKEITVASLYLLDGDAAHIKATIIDGSRPEYRDSGSVVYFDHGEGTNSVLCGFTITGGTGTRWYYSPSNSTLRTGGGIYCMNSGARIISNIIASNKVIAPAVALPGRAGAHGGGLCAINLSSAPREVVLESNVITDNIVYGLSNTWWMHGGGAVLLSVGACVVDNVFEANSVINNSILHQIPTIPVDVDDAFERTSVINSYAGVGGGLSISIIDAGHLRPNAHVKGNVFRSNAVTVASLGAVGVGLSLLLTDESEISDNLFESNIGTSHNGWAQGGGLLVEDHLGGHYGRKMIVGNRFFNNRTSHGGAEPRSGAGILLWETTASLGENQIFGNSADHGGGGFCAYKSSFVLDNNVIARNTTTTSGAGCAVSSGAPPGTERLIINNTIVDNQAGYSAGGLSVSGGGPDVVVFNNIFWGNDAPRHTQIYNPWTIAKVYYCDVQGGYAGTGNSNAPPQFLPGGYSLSDTSPCVGTGIDSVNVGGVWYVAPNHCIRGPQRPVPSWSMPDMGACENGLPTPSARMHFGPESFTASTPERSRTRAILTIGNYGGSPLEWSITAIPGGSNTLDSWLSVDPSSGTTASGEETQVTVTMEAVEPAGWIQEGSLTISSSDITTGPWTLPVALSVLRILSAQIEPTWNILSVPFVPTDYRTTALFPSATSTAFRYIPGAGYYSRVHALENSYGYWLRFRAAQTRTLAGFPIFADTFAVVAGWNLIGSISVPVPVHSIGTIPGGIVTSPFFTYTPTGYAVSGTIAPFKGYWVKSTQAGLLVLAAVPQQLGKIRIRSTGELPPPPPREVPDATEKLATELPKETALEQNFPNPFNPVTDIRFQITDFGRVVLSVYDILGREVATLVNEPKEPGVYTVQWDASAVGSGVYFYRLQAGGFTATKRMVLVK